MSIRGFELTVRRRGLGLTPVQLARVLGMDQSTLIKIEGGVRQLPAHRLEILEKIEELAERVVDEMINSDTAPTVTTFRTDEAMWKAHPELRDETFSVMIHQACAGQAVRWLRKNRREGDGEVVIVEG